MLTPLIFFNLVLQMIFGFTVFTSAFIISGGTGAPLDSVLLYSLYLYQKGFKDFQMGYAAAMAWALLLVIACFTALIFRLVVHWVHYERDRRTTNDRGRALGEPKAREERSGRSSTTAFVWAFGFIMLYPLLWVVPARSSRRRNLHQRDVAGPRRFTLDNYVQGWAGFGGIPFMTFFTQLADLRRRRARS